MDSNQTDLSPLLSELNNIIVCLDLNSIIVEFNTAAEDFFKCKKKDVIGTPFTEFSKRFNFHISLDNNLVIEKGMVEYPLSFQYKPDHSYCSSWKFLPLRTRSHVIQNFILVGRDTMHEQMAKDANKIMEKRIESIIELMTGYYWWKDLNGVYRGCNGRVVSLLGFESKDEVIGKNDYELPWISQASELIKHDQEVLEKGIPIQRLEETTLRDGRTLTFLVTKTVLKDDYGNIIGTMGNAVDITAEKNAFIQCEAAKKAEMESKAKSELIADMSHDLRSPLTGIVGIAELLEKRVLPKDKELVHSICRASKSLLHLFNDIIEDIKFESGHFPICHEMMDIKKVVEEVLDLVMPSVEEKHLRIATYIDDSVPHAIITDLSRVRRILLNLLSNAIKFTTKGEISIHLAIDSKADDKNKVLRLTVKDTGIGIPANQLDHIFTRFSRLPSSYQRDIDGIGIGLSIVKQFVDDLKGSIKVESDVNIGTAFICLLPLEEVSTNVKHNQTLEVLP